MTDLRAFLRRHIEAFLDHEFGPTQNMTPSGIRRILWTSEHTGRLVHHLEGNWEMVEEALRVRQEVAKTDTALHGDGQWLSMDERYAADPGEVAADNAQADAAAAQSTVHHAGCAYCPTRFDCTCDSPGQRHMCPRCDDAAEESKVTGSFPIGGETVDQAIERGVQRGLKEDTPW